VTTLKDTAANVEKWVRRNLGGGIDHMVVFLDGPQPEVQELLDGHPHVTPVLADDAWFTETPHVKLNDRQIVNAAVTSRLLGGLPWAQWLFHLDGDEVAVIDRDALAAVDPDTRAVRMRALEAVGQLHVDADPTLFKRWLTDDELLAVSALGGLDKPSNYRYFRGHTGGKPGVRPTAELAIGVHRVVDPEGERMPRVDVPGLHVLHYESFNGAEFVRKWMALLSSGGEVSQRGNRARISDSIRTLFELELTEEDTRSFLNELYQRLCADDVELLSELGLLVAIDPDAFDRPVESSVEGVRQLRTLLDRVRVEPKRGFRPRTMDPHIADVVARLQQDL
jgi:hypothetical protein